jgi:predicted transcriptional regulator
MQLSKPPSATGKAKPSDQGRLLVRLLGEMQTSALASGIRAFDGDLDRAIIFMVVARESELLSRHSAGYARHGDRGPKAISINALAASLARPFETVRRHIHALCNQGLCVRTKAGVTVPADVHDRPAIAGVFRLDHDALVRLVEDMAWFGIPLPERRPQTGYDWRTGLAAAQDVLLTGIEFNAHRFQAWIDMAILVAISCANARPFLYDRDVSLAYASFARIPGEAMRAPVSTGALARALGLATSTTHRRVSAMIRKGLVVRKPKGLLLSDAALNDPLAIEDSRTGTDHTRQILIRLAAGGFCFDDPASCYVEGRPPLVSFE